MLCKNGAGAIKKQADKNTFHEIVFCVLPQSSVFIIGHILKSEILLNNQLVKK